MYIQLLGKIDINTLKQITTEERMVKFHIQVRRGGEAAAGGTATGPRRTGDGEGRPRRRLASRRCRRAVPDGAFPPAATHHL